VFHLPLRQTEGLIGSVLQLLGLDLPVPDFSTLSRRAQNLELPVQPRATGVHLLVDSSGLKLGGPGEWLVEKHGTSKRRSWRKLHIGFDAVTGRIVASILTDRDVDDASYAFRMNGLADPFWANFERFLVVLWPPFEKGVRSDLIQIVCKDTATFSENLIKFIQRLEVFIDDGLVGQRP